MLLLALRLCSRLLSHAVILLVERSKSSGQQNLNTIFRFVLLPSRRGSSACHTVNDVHIVDTR